ncbi:MAG: acetoacetate--CoA ligase [Polyangiaceae bacterium]|jgi:acetoacetyl-CoA synthetase
MKHLLHSVDAAKAAHSQLADFARFVETRVGRTMADYRALHAFSISDIESFWSLFLEWSAARTSGDAGPACVGTEVETARFFPGIRLSWVEHVLAEGDGFAEDEVAVIACDETGARQELSRRALRRRVRALAAGLESLGVGAGDRVVAVVGNRAESVIACLASASIGATWSSVAPSMGVEAALARFGPLEPTVLFVQHSAAQGGLRLEVPAPELARGLPSLRVVVSLDEAAPAMPLPCAAFDLGELEKIGADKAGTDPHALWPRFAFDHPLFTLFSSATTGAPKCITHGHGGTLLEHLKEHRLHCDLGPADRLLFQTSTGWMMWNWQLSALATGAAIVLYDGSVSHPDPDSLLQIVARERVTVFGTSPAYLQYARDAGLHQARHLLAGVREIHSTGSVLFGPLHRWAREHFADAPIQSISGGTDILGCFVMGSPWTPTYEGESSCIGLGLDVRAWTPQGAGMEGPGELVCARPFPSRPVGFVGDPSGRKLHETYFAQHEGLWTHGDLIERTSHGTVRVVGRCDGVLNIRGIRIGPTEIYEVLASAAPEVVDAMAVDEEAVDEPGGKRLILFVVLKRGAILDRSLVLRLKKEIHRKTSSAHVPSEIVQVDDLPKTFSGKKSEVALQDALHGRAVRNRSALANPQAIDEALDRLRRHRSPRREAGADPNPRPRRESV